jgi:hypothetical protein
MEDQEWKPKQAENPCKAENQLTDPLYPYPLPIAQSVPGSAARLLRLNY